MSSQGTTNANTVAAMSTPTPTIHHQQQQNDQNVGGKTTQNNEMFSS
jgi:hypothetical protein